MMHFSVLRRTPPRFPLFQPESFPYSHPTLYMPFGIYSTAFRRNPRRRPVTVIERIHRIAAQAAHLWNP